MHSGWETFKSDPAPYALISPEGQFLKVNPAFSDLMGYTEEALCQLTVLEVTHPEDRIQSLVLVEKAARRKETCYQVIKRYIHQDGHIIWALLSTTLERDDEMVPTNFLSHLEDITDKIETDPILKAFSKRMQTIKEQERQGIARELHEELGQTFAGLKLELDRLQALLPTDTAAQAGRLSSLADHTLHSIRRFTAALRPPILDDLGLESALEWLLKDTCANHDLKWQLKTESVLSLDWETRIALFRIVQEGLGNIIRHAEASKVEIRLTQNRGIIIMKLIDDGLRIQESSDRARGLGLYLLKERAQLLNGSVTMGNYEAQGTVVEVRLPAPLPNTKNRDLIAAWE